MKLELDSESGVLEIEDEGGRRQLPLYSPEAFEALSRWWLKVGWNQKYTYTFSWMGRPIIQLPEDMFRIQEVIHRTNPDVIVETGIAHGGSLVFYASLCKARGKGRVIGIDIEIRAHNREALERHELFEYITLIEGDSTASETLRRVQQSISGDERCLVVLDSAHDRAHVRAELEAYAPLVSSGSYVVVADGIMRDLADVPRGHEGWLTDNPLGAIDDFLADHPEFVQEEPAWEFDESEVSTGVSHWPSGYLRKQQGLFVTNLGGSES